MPELKRLSIVLTDDYRAAERLRFRRLEGVEIYTVTAGIMRALMSYCHCEVLLIQQHDGRRGYERAYLRTDAAEERPDLVQAIDECHRMGTSRSGEVRTKDDLMDDAG